MEKGGQKNLGTEVQDRDGGKKENDGWTEYSTQNTLTYQHYYYKYTRSTPKRRRGRGKS